MATRKISQGDPTAHKKVIWEPIGKTGLENERGTTVKATGNQVKEKSCPPRMLKKKKKQGN